MIQTSFIDYHFQNRDIQLILNMLRADIVCDLRSKDQKERWRIVSNAPDCLVEYTSWAQSAPGPDPLQAPAVEEIQYMAQEHLYPFLKQLLTDDQKAIQVQFFCHGGQELQLRPASFNEWRWQVYDPCIGEWYPFFRY